MAFVPTVGKRLFMQTERPLDRVFVEVTKITHPASSTSPFWLFEWKTELKQGEARLGVGERIAVLVGERHNRTDIDPIPF